VERVDGVVGWLSDPTIADAVHELAHRDRVEHVEIPTVDAARRRLRVVTDRGAELAVALERSERLGDGAVLVLTTDRAVVLHLAERRWLRIRPVGIRAALAVGHRAGHLHWTVRIDGDVLAVALEGDVDDYLTRLRDLDGLDVLGHHALDAVDVDDVTRRSGAGAGDRR